MSLYVLDTNIVSLFERGHPRVCQRILSCSPADLAITILTVEEQLTGWYAQLRRARNRPQTAAAYLDMRDALISLASWPILLLTEPAIDRYHQLVSLKLNVAKMDLRIAAVTLEHGGILVTQNVRDFQRIPGLAIENWTV